MGFELKDIIDLEFLLELDETVQESEQDDIAARDRDIFHQITSRDTTSDLSDEQMVGEWLSYRRLLYSHQTESPQPLPGDLFETLIKWAGRGCFWGG